MASKPYLISSVIGNGKMLATLGKNSELYRIFWPHIDNYQHLRNSFGGIHAGEGTWWFVDPSKWDYDQAYLPDSNIVRTVLLNEKTQLEVTIHDLIEPHQDILVRRFEILNKSNHVVPIRFLYFAAFNFQNHIHENAVYFSREYDALVHYRHGYHFAVGADLASSGFQCGHAFEDGHDGYLSGAVLNMSPEGAQVWDLGLLHDQETTTITVYMCPGFSVREAGEKLVLARQMGYQELFSNTVNYWHDFLSHGRQVDTGNQEINSLYKRSLLVCGLLCDRENGGIIAAPEFDEQYVKSGGYGYCWPRDGVFVADAMSRAGYRDIAERFYVWAERTQLPEGQWFQRYDTEGNLAPGWGNQIDETGSVLWGIWQHYVLHSDQEFLRRTWPAVLKGAEFLVSFLDEETALPKPSFDLWEERIGEHAYSSAAVYGGLLGAAVIAREAGRHDLSDRWQRAAMEMAQAMGELMWDGDKKCFLRTIKKSVGYGEYHHKKAMGEKVYSHQREKGYDVYLVADDKVLDASLLGLVYPFEVFSPLDERIQSTVEWIEKVLVCGNTGGIIRYENDHYIGGNPWINTTLWLSIYYIRAGKMDRAASLLQWATQHRTELGLLPEQVDRHNGQPAWVIPLTWSHAIYVLAVLEYLDSGQS